MGNVFDQFDTPRSQRQAAPMAPVAPAAPTANVFDQFERPRAQRAAPLPPGAVDWSRYNQPMGELKPAQLSPSERLVSGGQDVLIAAGMDPYRARHIAEGVTSAARINPLVNAAVAGADLPYDIAHRNIGGAVGDVLGVAPGVWQGARYLRGAPTIPMADTPLGVTPPRSAFGPRDINQVSLLPERGAPDPYGLGRYGIVGPQPRGRPMDELQLAGQEAYRRTAANPTLYHPQSQRDFIFRTIQDLAVPGSHGTPHIPENSPEFYNLMQRWYDRSLNRANPITTAEWDAFRQELRSLPAGPSGAAGGKAIDRLDNYMYQPPAGAVVAGTQSDLDNLRRDLGDARGNWRAYRTAQSIENELTRRTSQAIVRNEDPGDAARATLDYFANTKAGANKIWGAAPEQRAAIRAAAESGPATARWLGNTLGGPWAAQAGATLGAGSAHLFGLDPTMTVGAGVVGAGIPKAVSVPLKNIASTQATQAAEDIIGNIRRASPLYAERSAPPVSSSLPTAPGTYAPPSGTPPITDPGSQLRDAIAYAMLPQTSQPVEDIWNEQRVPYSNREDRLRVTPLPPTYTEGQ